MFPKKSIFRYLYWHPSSDELMKASELGAGEPPPHSKKEDFLLIFPGQSTTTTMDRYSPVPGPVQRRPGIGMPSSFLPRKYLLACPSACTTVPTKCQLHFCRRRWLRTVTGPFSLHGKRRSGGQRGQHDWHVIRCALV